MKVLLMENGYMPTRGTPGSAGFDLKSTKEYKLKNCLQKIPLAIKLGLPKNYYGHICCKSSLAAQGCSVEAGVIDEDYRGEVSVMLRVRDTHLHIKKGQKIAQLLIIPYYKEIEQVESLDTTKRGTGGFGSTGEI